MYISDFLEEVSELKETVRGAFRPRHRSRASAAKEFLDDLEDVDGEGDIVEDSGCDDAKCKYSCNFIGHEGKCEGDKCMCV
ncbi:hypothetical protein NPIL_281691 [Nephila pilipes]|uniref:Uncharacterized protein n=1 Tax=Nephila pilipes TaxID=299642 RepID=A0A8X6NML9_NEPPI|nr:hypothetical protein NPIL_281691 [Nephila pilipes]